MLLGDFESAWRESDLIATRGNADPHRFWDGQPFAVGASSFAACTVSAIPFSSFVMLLSFASKPERLLLRRSPRSNLCSRKPTLLIQ